MKDLTMHIHVMLEEDSDDSPIHIVFNESLYLSLPLELTLSDVTRNFLTETAARLVRNALEQAKKEYQPELEVVS